MKALEIAVKALEEIRNGVWSPEGVATTALAEIAAIHREQSPVDEQDQSAQPCIYCGSKTSVCDQSIAHPAKSGKGEV